MNTEDREWLAQLDAVLRADLDTALSRTTVERLWKLGLLNDWQCSLLLGVLTFETLTERQLVAVHDVKLRVLLRVKELTA